MVERLISDTHYAIVEMGRWHAGLPTMPLRPDAPLYLYICVNTPEHEMWSVRKIGTPQEIARFIETAVPRLPDSALIHELLAELNSKIPEGLF